MEDLTTPNMKRHKRGQESLSKCKSLPSLQFAADPPTTFTCPKCGLSSSFMVVCTRCYKRNDGEEGDDLKATESGNKHSSWNLLSEHAASDGSTELHKATSQQTSDQSRRVQQTGHADGSKGSTSLVEAPLIAPLRFATSFDEPLADPLSWISEHSADLSFTPQLDQTVKESSGRDSETNLASTSQTTAESSHREDDQRNTSVTMAPSTVVLAYTPAHPSASAISLTSGAGSCLPSSSSRSSMSSTSRQLRLRSKSLFSLNKHQSSTTIPPSEANATSTSLSSKDSCSTATMFVAARALTKRLSFATMRSAESPSPAPLPETKHSKLSLSLEPNDDFSEKEDGGRNQTLRRKKRLGGPPLPQIPPTPIHDSTLNATLPSPQLSSHSSQRPDSIDSDRVKTLGVKFNLSNESYSNSSLAKGKGVDRTSTHASSGRPAPAVHVTKPSVDDHTPVLSQPPPSAPVSILKRPSPTASINSTSSNGQPSQPPPQPTRAKPAQSYSGPRIGTPSRPYYSVIRKHCMSAPAPTPYKPATPDLVYIPTVTTAGARPPPSSFPMQNTSRRPLSVGAFPMTAPGIGSVISGSQTNSQGIDVFNVDIESDSEDEQIKRKTNSLSRAFIRKKRRTWSSGSHDTPMPPPPSSFFNAKPPADSSRRHSQSSFTSVRPMTGTSMSGEIELRMSLAAMEQQERAQRREQQQRDGVVNPTPEPPLKYSFKPRPVNAPSTGDAAKEKPANQPSGSGMFAKVKKFKGIMKGILG